MHDDLTTAVEMAYAAATDPTRWPDALTAVTDVLGGVDTTLELHGVPGAPPDVFECGGRLPTDGIGDYVAHFMHVCPRVPSALQKSALNPRGFDQGAVWVDHDFITETRMDRDEFYTDFLAPYGLRYFLAAQLTDPKTDQHGVLTVQRSPKQGHASAEDVQRLQWLVPHFSRALDIQRRLGLAHLRENTLLETLEHVASGVLVLDAKGRVIRLNTIAEDILSDEDGLCLNNGLFSASEPGTRASINKLLANVMPDGQEDISRLGGEVSVPRPSGKAPYMISVRRLPLDRAATGVIAPGPAGLVFVHDPACSTLPSPQHLQALFGLTGREADVVIAVCEGESLREHADARAVSITTVRSHLYKAMDKIGVRRQSELVQLVQRLHPPVS